MASKKKVSRRMGPVRVAELFAGVGGFRLGLEAVNDGRSFEVVWHNQWEPTTKVQHAADVYDEVFGELDEEPRKSLAHDARQEEGGLPARSDIFQVLEHAPDAIRKHDLLVGGFPCQDYSVARTKGQAAGLIGKKGVLWWAIHEILKAPRPTEGRPRYALLENVDRLLKSPASCRGRDFSIMLASLAEIGFCVEWRVINAAEYGFAQRRRRVFIIAYHVGTQSGKALLKSPGAWLSENGVFAKAFKATLSNIRAEGFSADAEHLTKEYRPAKGGRSPFGNAGVAWPVEDERFSILTADVKVPKSESRRGQTLGSVISRTDESRVPQSFVVDDVSQWEYLKGAKKEKRKDKKTGHEYYYTEGGMRFPEPLDEPSRTIVTGEGGPSPSRFKHVIEIDGRYRRLIPEELEELNGFPRGHTAKGINGPISANRRAFFMGNALVVGVVKRIGEELVKRIRED